MRICRFDTDRLGVIRGDAVVDVTSVVDSIPPARWPLDPGDPLISNLDRLRGMLDRVSDSGERRHLADCAFKSPIANPTKIIGAVANYRDWTDEAEAMAAAAGNPSSLERDGMFLKAVSALAGPSEGIELLLPGREHIHEVELAAVIGSWCRNVSRERALDHVAGYTIALDMTVRGSEDRSLRKSPDGHAVLGPWLVTRDEILNPGDLGLWLHVNGQSRQRGSTRNLLADLPRLIEYASTFFTLYPGDIILTGTPPGAGPVVPGDIIDAGITGIGSMRVEVR